MLLIQVSLCYILKHLEDTKTWYVHIYYTWCDIILIFKLHRRTRLTPRSSIHSLKLRMTSHPSNCCRKTAVSNRDQLLDFSVPELVRNQSTFSTDPEVLQNCAGFTLSSSASLAEGECSAVMGLTPCALRVQIYCVLCVLDYYLLHSQL